MCLPMLVLEFEHKIVREGLNGSGHCVIVERILESSKDIT